MPELISSIDRTDTLLKKVEFLSRPESYGDATHVDVIETHMSMVFVTDRYVYKLKKPVLFDFLDFSTPEARRNYCYEEIKVNQPLAGDTYMGVVALTSHERQLELNGGGGAVDWLVKMKRLPKDSMLQQALIEGTARSEWVQLAAEKITRFYLSCQPALMDLNAFRSQVIRDIEDNSSGLLTHEFKLNHSVIICIATDLLHFIIKYVDMLKARISDGRIIDAHGDLRPDHICLRPEPIIIDRLEFNDVLRIMDVAEELSFLAMECEILRSAEVGQLFLDTYQKQSQDHIPAMLISFYKAKRAFLRARLSINHLLEKQYKNDADRWREKCQTYLTVAGDYCKKL